MVSESECDKRAFIEYPCAADLHKKNTTEVTFMASSESSEHHLQMYKSESLCGIHM